MTRPHTPQPGELPSLGQLNRATLIALGAAAALLVHFIKDATFSRIRELSLTYMYNGSALENVGLSSLTFTGTARNLFAWYKELVGVDPGVNVGGIQTGFGLDYFANPSTKSFLFSLTANF